MWLGLGWPWPFDENIPAYLKGSRPIISDPQAYEPTITVKTVGQASFWPIRDAVLSPGRRHSIKVPKELPVCLHFALEVTQIALLILLDWGSYGLDGCYTRRLTIVAKMYVF